MALIFENQEAVAEAYCNLHGLNPNNKWDWLDALAAVTDDFNNGNHWWKESE